MSKDPNKEQLHLGIRKKGFLAVKNLEDKRLCDNDGGAAAATHCLPGL